MWKFHALLPPVLGFSIWDLTKNIFMLPEISEWTVEDREKGRKEICILNS